MRMRQLIIGALVTALPLIGPVRSQVIPPAAGSGESRFTEAPLEIEDSSSGAGRPVSQIVVFAKGALRQGDTVTIAAPDGSSIETQFVKLASWHDDGSVLSAMLAFETPDSGDNTGTYKIVPGTPVTGRQISKEDIVAAASNTFDSKVTAIIDDTTYCLSARDLLDGTVDPTQDYTYWAGPKASSYVVGGHLRVDSGDGECDGMEHPGGLGGYFEVIGYGTASSVDDVYVVAVLENTGANHSLSNVRASSVTVTIGESTVQSHPAFTIFADARYPARGWFGSDPGIWSHVNVDYIQSTKLVPDFIATSVTSSALDSFPAATQWNSPSVKVSSGGGYQAALSPISRWSASWFASGDVRAYQGMRVEHDDWMSLYLAIGGKTLTHPRDEETGHPVNLETDLRQSQRDAGSSGAFEAGKAGRTGSHNTTDSAHWPSVGWSMYLTDGEFADLESQIFSGHAQWINADPGRVLRNGSDRAFGPVGQTRSLAWGLREILHAELITPDRHPLKGAQQYLVERALISMTNAVTTRSPAHDGNIQGWDMGLFLWCCGTSSVEYDAANMAAGFSGGNVGTAFWQQAWLQWAIMLYSLHGWHDEASVLSDWAIPGLIDRFGYDLETDGYCWNRAVAYKVGVRYTSSSDFFANMRELFAANWPEISECAPYGASMFDDTSQTTRAHAVAPGLAVAVALGWPGASMAADYYLNRDYNYSWNDLPQWGIRPWQ